jgi:hypothetical protein
MTTPASVPKTCPRLGHSSSLPCSVAVSRCSATVRPSLSGRCSTVSTSATKNRQIAGGSSIHESLLTDPNRRPPPYHGATRRERRARPGSRGHERRARTRICPKARDRAWTPVPALVFPQSSLGVLSPSWRKHAGPAGDPFSGAGGVDGGSLAAHDHGSCSTSFRPAPSPCSSPTSRVRRAY